MKMMEFAWLRTVMHFKISLTFLSSKVIGGFLRVKIAAKIKSGEVAMIGIHVNMADLKRRSMKTGIGSIIPLIAMVKIQNVHLILL